MASQKKPNPPKGGKAAAVPPSSLREPTVLISFKDGLEAETDLGNAHRFIERNKETLRYVTDWESWVYYEDGCWHRDPKGVRAKRAAQATARVLKKEARNYEAKQWAIRSQAAPRIQAMVNLAADDERLELSHDVFDKKPLLLNVKNGTLNLETGKLQPHSKDDYLTKIAPVDFDAKARSKKWESALRTSLPEFSDRDFVQRFLGYCLSGDVGERIVVMWVGSGRNGKSLLARAIQELMGPYATTLASTVLMANDGAEQHPTEIADLFGTRLAIMSELRRGRAIDDEKFKRLSGNDTLKARRMREDFWSFQPTHKSLFLINHKPRVGRDQAVWDRIVVVDFKVRIPDSKVDVKLLDKLKREETGILTWLVEGYAKYKKKGLKPPATIVKATAEYQASEDRLKEFFEDECSFEEDAEIVTSHLTKAVTKWALGRNIRPPSPNEMAERLKEKGCAATRIGHEALRGWRGICLKKPASLISASGSDPKKASSALKKDHLKIVK